MQDKTGFQSLYTLNKGRNRFDLVRPGSRVFDWTSKKYENLPTAPPKRTSFVASLRISILLFILSRTRQAR